MTTLPPPAVEPQVTLAAPLGSSRITGRTQWQIFWNGFRRHRIGMVAAFLLLGFALVCLIYPWLSSIKFDDIEPDAALQPPGWPHIFGTRDAGEDLFVQVLYGGRTSLLVGLATAAVATLVGALLGALAGYYGGWLDSLIARLTDVFLTVPPLAALIALSAITGQLSLLMIVVVIAAFSWMSVTRLIRAEFIALKEREFVQAARAMGASNWRIMWRHMLPNTVSVLVVAATLLVGSAILTESALSFLGLGLNILENPSWGNLLDRAKEGVTQGQWWPIFFPGAAVIFTVLCVNFVGDALRDALDPHRTSVTSGSE